ncbi:MAG: acyl carrier protein [Halioglobus sp.]|nr:acyl carrier protein [Halioglobus sp.]
MKTREDIRETLRQLLVEMFEVDPSAISDDAKLYEDLDIDSIDAVDLIVEFRSLTGKQIDPDVFKAVRTVEDVVNAVSDIIGTP